MGLPSGKSLHARHRDAAGGADDPRQAQRQRGAAGWRAAGLILATLLAALPASADPLRIATWNIGLERPGPGLLLQDIDRGTDPDIAAAIAVLVRLDADIVVLTGMDYDPALLALQALARRLADQGLAYPHLHAPRPNSGQPTGHDVDGDGAAHGPADAQGWGRFPGAGGSAILSRLPLLTDHATDHSTFLWRDLPGHLMPPTDPALAALQRLSSHSHLQLPVALPDGRPLTLLIWHATPPVFDGPEDRNGRRNHDEAAFWLRLLDGGLPTPPPSPPFVLIGDANLDPADGDGRPQAMTALLTHPLLQDPAPRGTHRRTEPAHQGDPALDTVLYETLGGLRLDYVLPSRDLAITAAGVLWPPADDPFADTLAAASRHYPVWVDVALPMLISPSP
jgi:hypothetical protein